MSRLSVILGMLISVVALEVPRYTPYPPISGEHEVLVLRVIDGDTVEIGYVSTQKIRLYGINAPEINTAEGKASRSALALMLPQGTFQYVTVKGPDKYHGRQVGDFKTKDGWVSVQMIGSGNAKPWDGKGQKPK